MNACCLFGWWGLNLWVPAYLNLPVERGGVGLSSAVMSWFVIAMQVGMWFGYVSFGYIADAIGRKPAYVTFVLMAALLLPLYGALREPWMLLLLGPAVAFFGTGYYSGFGAVIAELYPTSVRATAAGIGYNVGRIASAAAPFVVGSMVGTSGFGAAFAVTGAAFLGAALMSDRDPGHREPRAHHLTRPHLSAPVGTWRHLGARFPSAAVLRTGGQFGHPCSRSGSHVCTHLDDRGDACRRRFVLRPAAPAVSARPAAARIRPPRSTTRPSWRSPSTTRTSRSCATSGNCRLPRGTGDLHFMDIAATVNPATVHFRSLTEPSRVSVLEQNYEYRPARARQAAAQVRRPRRHAGAHAPGRRHDARRK